jgi:hypothetical protein
MPGQESQSKIADVLGSDVEMIRSELLRLKAEVAAHEECELKDVDSESPDLTSLPSPEEVAADEQEWRETYVAQLDLWLEDEREDGPWSRDIKAGLREKFEPMLPYGSQWESSCGTSLCRLKLRHLDASGHDTLLNALQDHIPWDGPTVVLPDDASENRTVIYFARDGHELPVPSK